MSIDPVLTQQIVYMVLAVWGIILIPCVLSAQRCANHRRHPMTTAFLAMCWITDWCAMIPLLGNVWAYSHPAPFHKTNVEPGHARTLCNASALLTSFCFPTLGTFALAFSGEVLRIVLIARYTKIGRLPNTTNKPSEGPDVHSSHSETIYPYRIASIDSSPPTPKASRSVRLGIASWMLLCLPFAVGLACFSIALHYDALGDFRWVNATPLYCAIPWDISDTYISTITLVAFGLSALIALLAVAFYSASYRRNAFSRTSALDKRLVLRLGGLAVLSAFGAMAFGIFRLHPGGASKRFVRLHAWIPPMTIVANILIGSCLFIDKTVVNEWKRWGKALHNSIAQRLHRKRCDASPASPILSLEHLV